MYHEICSFFPSSDNVVPTIIFVDAVSAAHMIVDTLREHLGWTGEKKDYIQPYHSIRGEQGKQEASEEFR